jgi:hypothetical protein
MSNQPSPPVCGDAEPASPDELLAAARSAKARSEDADREVLRAALAWAVMHPAETVDDAAGYPTGGDQAVPIAGEGTPLVAEFAVCEFGAALGLNATAAKGLVGQAVELRYRLPRCWAQVTAGQVPAWKAKMAARETMSLSKTAAGEVDKTLAPVLGRSGIIVIHRIVEEVRLRHADASEIPTEDYQPDGRHAVVDTRGEDDEPVGG